MILCLTHTTPNNQLMSVMISCLFLLPLFQFCTNVKAQNDSHNTQTGTHSEDSVSNFEPSLAVVIGILSIIFSLAFIILLYAKFCHRTSSSSVVAHNTGRQIDGLIRSRSSVSGIDKTIIESLPFFRFSSLKGLREGLECAVCLSKFEDIEILRLLPKCKHGFHIDCIDQWLEKHSTCPLCRQKVSLDHLSQMQPYYSNSSLRSNNLSAELWREESNGLDLYVEREESRLQQGSLRFCSFRKCGNSKATDEDELPIQESDCDNDNKDQPLHKFNHKIVVSDNFLKNRWSNVSSSDLMFLNSEMLNDVSSARLSSRNYEERFNIESSDRIMNIIKEEMDKKRVFESKIRVIKHKAAAEDAGDCQNNDPLGSNSRILSNNQRRSMSEIIVHPRFRVNKDSSSLAECNNVKEDKVRRLWVPIARKTVQWFADRQSGPNQPLNL